VGGAHLPDLAPAYHSDGEEDDGSSGSDSSSGSDDSEDSDEDEASDEVGVKVQYCALSEHVGNTPLSQTPPRSADRSIALSSLTQAPAGVVREDEMEEREEEENEEPDREQSGSESSESESGSENTSSSTA
jgi:hypothetical protein